MGDLKPNISRSECACKCGCGFQTCDIETANVIQDACDHFALELKVPRVTAVFNSWCRCVKHNKRVGGVNNSKHLEGIATDWFIKEVSVQDLYNYLDKKYPKKYCLGLYPGRIHFDTQPNRRRYVGK